MSKSAKAKVDELLAREFHHLRERKIHKIPATMEVQLYGAEKVTTSKRNQFQVRLKRARQAATIWSDADRQMTIERLEREMHQWTPVRRKLFDKVFQHHERQLLQEVGTKATGPRRRFAKKLAQMKTAPEEDACRAVNMTADNGVQFQVFLCNIQIEATTWSIADMDRIVNQLGRDIYCITSKDQMQFMKEFSFSLVEFEAWCQALSVQELQKTIEQGVIHFGYPKLHLGSYIS